MSRLLGLAVGMMMLAAPWQTAGAAPFLTFGNFAGACGTTLVCAGAAAENGANLRLVPALQEQAGAAWFKKPISLAPGLGFVSTFNFRLSNPSEMRADGLAFVLAADPLSLGDPSRYGGSMGFEGVGRSLAVEFDVYDNDGIEVGGSNHVAIDRNGVLSDTAAASPFGQSDCARAANPGCMANGSVWTALVAYDGKAETLSVALGEAGGPMDVVIDGYKVSLREVVEGNQAYVGFGAGTGYWTMDHDLVDWTMTIGNASLKSAEPEVWMSSMLAAGVDVPEPASAALLGFAALALARGRRRG